MAENSIPQQGITVGDAIQAPYDADEWSILYTAVLTGFGSRANYGVIRGYDNNIQTSLQTDAFGGANIRLSKGAALVRGTLYINDDQLILTVQANASGNPRIDTMILRKDYVAQTIRAVILQGTPAASPVAPTLTQSAGSIWEIPLANIAVANGFASITQANISPRHEYVNVSDALYLDNIRNNSGGTLEDGDVVIWDNSITNTGVTTTTTGNSHRVAGVWRGTTANQGRGRLQVQGIGRVRIFSDFGGSVSVGSPIVTHSTAKFGANPFSATGIPNNGAIFEFARTLQIINPSATGYYLCNIALRSPTESDYVQIQETANSGTAAGAFNSGSDQTRKLNTLIGNTFGASVGSNQFILPAGRYYYRGKAPAYAVSSHRVALHNVTDATTVYGSSADSGTAAQTISEIQGLLTITATKTFELRHRCQSSKATDGMGRPASFGGSEIYAAIEFWRLPDRDTV